MQGSNAEFKSLSNASDIQVLKVPNARSRQRSFAMKKGSTLKRNKRLMLTHGQAWQSSGWLVGGRHWHKLDPSFPGDQWQLTVRKELDMDEKGQPL